MIELVYERAGIIDARTFGSSEELVNWLKRQCLIEKVTIIKVRNKIRSFGSFFFSKIDQNIKEVNLI